MKNWYDIDKKERKELYMTFIKKYGSIKKGLIIGCALGVFIAISLIYYWNSENMTPFIILLSITAIICIYFLIDETISFNRWLKTSKKIIK